MSKDNFLLPIYSLLTVGIMVYTFHWFDGQNQLPSHVALQTAEQSVGRYCAKMGLRPYEMQLMDESAPDAKNPNWRFRFQSDRNNRVTVEVAQDGKPRLLSGVTD